MSKNAHTPGPWITEDNNYYVWTAAPFGERDLIAECERKSDARLISAAPDLLAALEAAIEHGMVPKSSAAEGGAVRHSSQVQVADQIRAAISKAKGEA